MSGRLASVREARARRALLRRTAKALLPPPASAFAAYGVHTVVVPPARVETPECIELGAGILIHEHGWLCVQRRPDLPAPRLVVGDRTAFNRFLKIVCLGSVRIGEDVLTADRVYISDVEHLPWQGEAGEHPLTEPRPVVIGDRAFLGISSVVKPGVTVGADAYVGAGAVVREDVPPGGLVVGDPATLVRLRNPETGEWERV
jgi:acetyltransferase-like isoleucine patch superfamily enzyme